MPRKAELPPRYQRRQRTPAQRREPAQPKNPRKPLTPQDWTDAARNAEADFAQYVRRAYRKLGLTPPDSIAVRLPKTTTAQPVERPPQ